MKAYLVQYEDERGEAHVGYMGAENEKQARRYLKHVNVLQLTELPPETYQENIDDRPELELNY